MRTGSEGGSGGGAAAAASSSVFMMVVPPHFCGAVHAQLPVLVRVA